MELELSAVVCADCGITFYVDKNLDDSWRRTGKAFYCPNGHCLSYKDTPIDKLRKQLGDRDDTIGRLTERIAELSKRPKRKRKAKTATTKKPKAKPRTKKEEK